MSSSQPWYVAERAEVLAKVFLTRRGDVRVTSAASDRGFDLQVELLKDGAPTGRVFGVEIKAQVESRTDKEIRLRPQVRLNAEVFPVCLFFFTMEDDRGYWDWLSMPVLTSDERPRLEKPRVVDLRPLTTASIDEVVDSVNRW